MSGELTRNVCVDNVWYGPDYPDAGQPPADKVDAKFLNRKVEDVEDGEPMGWAAARTPEEAARFGGGNPLPDGDSDGDPRADVPEVEPVGIKAAQTPEEAATFRGRPTRRAAVGREAGEKSDEVKPDPAPTGTPRRASK